MRPSPSKNWFSFLPENLQQTGAVAEQRAVQLGGDHARDPVLGDGTRRAPVRRAERGVAVNGTPVVDGLVGRAPRTRPPAARRAPEAREADPTWARTGQPQRRWLALRSPRREPTPREHGARVRQGARRAAGRRAREARAPRAAEGARIDVISTEGARRARTAGKRAARGSRRRGRERGRRATASASAERGSAVATVGRCARACAEAASRADTTPKPRGRLTSHRATESH
jgi:hypothetical protein